jgi:putative intracellular protease/amidase
MSHVLFVVSAASSWTLTDGTAHPTGYWAEELLTPYRALVAASHPVSFATPGGAAPVADAASLRALSPEARAELEAIDGLRQPLVLAEVALADYDAAFYPGGHGPMEDLATDAASAALVASALVGEVPLGVVCHGAAALLPALAADGSPLVAGRRLAAFTDAEERIGGLADRAPFLLETRLRELGADVEAAAPWSEQVVVDGALVTGQNPQSSAAVAEAFLAALAG